MKIQYVLKDDLMTFPESTRFDTVHDFETVVTHADHLEAVKQARADALRWALEQMTDSAPNAVCSGDAGFDMQCGGIIAERARLRALIEKEIEK